MSYETTVFLMVMSFFAAFVGSCTGGGGLISIPALMLTGLPPSIVLGTNKIATALGAAAGVSHYARAGKIDFKTLKRLIPLIFLGGVLGTITVRYLSSEFLRPFVIVMLVIITIYTALRKDWDEYGRYKGLFAQKKGLTTLLLFILAFYDGFFGPGSGSFMLFVFLLMGYNFIESAANSKMMNFVSNSAAALTFINFGLYNIEYVIIMAVMMIPGGYAGSYVAVRYGTKYIRFLFLFISVILIGKQVINLLK